MPDPRLFRRGLSRELLTFVDESPLEREGILAAVRAFAERLAPGLRVLDVGAGDGPYRELFAHDEYVTVEWANSPHEGVRAVDIVASASALPLPDASFDAVLITQVLEHVPDPAAVVGEAHRVLRPAGRILVTVPFVWEEHERPFDFQRFSSGGVAHLLECALFSEIEVLPRGDCFSTLAQLMRNTRYAMGRAPDGLDAQREEASDLLDGLADSLLTLAPLDAQRTFPLGWQATACRS